MDTHRFTVGQTVRLLKSVINRAESMTCEVMQIMPYDGVCFQYRVRAENERFDRVAMEHELAEFTPPQTEMAPAGQAEGFKKFTPIAIKGNR